MNYIESLVISLPYRLYLLYMLQKEPVGVHNICYVILCTVNFRNEIEFVVENDNFRN